MRSPIRVSPRRPVLDVDDASDAVLLHRVVPQLEEARPVQRLAVVDQAAVRQPGKDQDVVLVRGPGNCHYRFKLIHRMYEILVRIDQ